MRLIDADALKMRLDDLEASGGHKYYRKGMDDTLHFFMPQIIDDAPTIDPEELRPKGRWNKINQITTGLPWKFRCSECGCPQDYDHNYCPNCGAKMEGEETNE